MRLLAVVYFPAFMVLACAPVMLLMFRRLGQTWGRILILILWLFAMTEIFWVIAWKMIFIPRGG